MDRLKTGKHEALLVDLKTADVSVRGIRRDITYLREECCKIAAGLIDSVWHIEKKEGVKHCPDCGKIVPELAVKFGGRLYVSCATKSQTPSPAESSTRWTTKASVNLFQRGLGSDP